VVRQAVFDRKGGQSAARRAAQLLEHVDVHTAAQHLQVQEGRWETTGRVLFGLEPGSPVL
jgi:hypothetical protein